MSSSIEAGSLMVIIASSEIFARLYCWLVGIGVKADIVSMGALVATNPGIGRIRGAVVSFKAGSSNVKKLPDSSSSSECAF